MNYKIYLKRCSRWLRLTLSSLLACVAFSVTPGFGAPMDGLESTFTQPDGAVITLKFYGDEFYARTETADGYTVVFDSATKSYAYADLSPDGTDFVSTGKRVGKVDLATLGVKKGITLNPAARGAKARKKAEAYLVDNEPWGKPYASKVQDRCRISS